MKKIPCVLTIAGSDSGGGAGIQADLKTFASFQVHGVSVITSVTAQNTCTVSSIYDLPAEIVRAQINALLEDMPINAVKTGMLRTSDLIEVVVNELKQDFPIVVDPVMVAKSGAVLMEKNAIKTLVEKLIPIAAVITPNIPEAEKISKIKILDVKDAKKAARKISEIGVEAVVIKGGHLKGDSAIDVLFHSGSYYLFEASRINKDTTHGTGCTFAAAIAVELAKGEKIHEAVHNAKKFLSDSISYGYKIGRGVGLVDPMARVHREAEKYFIIRSLKEAIEELERNRDIVKLVPEVQMNLVMAISNARSIKDVAGVEGRIVKLKDKVKATGCPEFGASSHVANTVLMAMQYDPSIRSGMNVKYSDEIIIISDKIGFIHSFYDRANEPINIKKREGNTTSWGAEQAIEKIGKVPDMIWHLGEWGKEPMISILARSPLEVVNKAIEIAKAVE